MMKKFLNGVMIFLDQDFLMGCTLEIECNNNFNIRQGNDNYINSEI